ncbi:MAG: endolytic transglycosylase MltG, partial [Actinomyces sp.]|nr:endolytic transglycosylase MltG [Actinomyces sp.]
MSDNTPGYPFPKRASIHQRRAQESVPSEPQVQGEESQPVDSPEASRTSARSRANDTDSDQILRPGSHEAPAPETAVPAGLPTRRTRRLAQEETASETTGMRSRRLAQERRAVRKRRRRRSIRTFIVLLLTLTLCAGGIYLAYTQLRGSSSSSTAADDFPGPGNGQVVVTIYDGESGQQIGQRLVDAGVVKSLSAFIRAFEANKAAVGIRPGSYTLKKEMSASGAIAALLDDANRMDNTVTVTPGQTKDQVAEQIALVTDIPLDQVNTAMADATT